MAVWCNGLRSYVRKETFLISLQVMHPLTRDTYATTWLLQNWPLFSRTFLFISRLICALARSRPLCKLQTLARPYVERPPVISLTSVKIAHMDANFLPHTTASTNSSIAPFQVAPLCRHVPGWIFISSIVLERPHDPLSSTQLQDASSSITRTSAAPWRRNDRWKSLSLSSQSLGKAQKSSLLHCVN